MVVVIGVYELWPLLIAYRAGKVMDLIKVGVNQPMVMIGTAACVDVLEGRKK
jgi:hypothetical protein